MSSNIPLGTHVSDGVRTGPIYTSQLPASLNANTNGVITSNDYSNYGPGILLSSQNTYNIKPSPPNPSAGYSILNNIVATTADGAVAGPMYLTLRGDNYSTYYTTGPTGSPLIQLDCPRVPSVTIDGAPATPNTPVTIFGYDCYGFPMQHTYTVGGEIALPTTYPSTENVGEIDTLPTLTLRCKAFYQITGVFVGAMLPADCVISVGASDIFGLPYVVNSVGTITSIQWGDQTNAAFPNTNPIRPRSDMAAYDLSGGAPYFINTLGVFVPADTTNPAEATSGDVRGLYAPSNAASAQYDGAGDAKSNQIAWKNLIFTAYIAGADTFINQVAAKQQQYMQQTGNPPQGVPIAPLTPSSLWGVPQFYTGVPSI